MKYSLLLVLISLAVTGSVSAQKRKCQNRFDTTLAKKHELIIAPGITGHTLLPGNMPTGGRGGSFNLEYARVYKANHFLRTGLRFAQVNRQSHTNLNTPAGSSFDNDPSTPGMAFQPYQSISKYEYDNDYGSVFVGYEYGVGRKSFRFTFGVDLNFGYNYRLVSANESWYMVDQTYDPATNFFHYDMQGYRSGKIRGTSHNLFLSLTPRLGIRRDLGRRIALALTFTPQFGYSQRVAYSETVTGDQPYEYQHPKSAWFAGANADIRVIFKLGKN